MFWFLFLLLIFFFIFRPLIRGMIGLYRIRRQVNDFFREAAGGTQESRRRESRQDTPPQKKKKISQDVGEYVSFEEIEVTQTETTAGSTRTETEYTQYAATSQIEDVEWEDVK